VEGAGGPGATSQIRHRNAGNEKVLDSVKSRRISSASTLLLGLLAVARPVLADYPLASHRYLADPASLVHDGRLYLYASNDDDNEGDDGYEMRSLVCISTTDLKNWTDHGEVFRVPTNASWASFSWAPAMVERGGTIYLYFGNNANGIGVATSTTPTGPFTDPRGSALVTASTPGASGTDSWLFDPGVLVDDDGQAYLYFGGNGDNNARVIRLNTDMVSVMGSAIALSVPNFFEASWMHKLNDVYYFSYSTNPAADMRIDYMTSSSPTSGFTYGGVVAPQPPSNGNNNHAAIFIYNGNWYHAYHNRYVSTEAGEPTTYRRNLAIDRLNHNSDGTIQQVVHTADGLAQLASLNPYMRVEAETTNSQSGIETEPCSEGGMNVTAIADGDWIGLRSVDFGTGAESFTARVASAASGGSIDLRSGSATGTVLGTCTVPMTGGLQEWADVTCAVTGATGETDLFLTFGGGTFNVNYWQFTPVDGGAGGAGGGAGASGAAGMAGNAGATGGAAGSAGGGATGGAGAVGGVGGASATGGSAGTTTGGVGGDAAGSGASAGTTSGMSGGAVTGGGTGGMGSGGVSAAGGLGGGASGGASGAGASAAAGSDETGGCGCRVPGGSSSGRTSAWFVVALALALRRRRRAA